jgi:hypothetical protein
MVDVVDVEGALLGKRRRRAAQREGHGQNRNAVLHISSCHVTYAREAAGRAKNIDQFLCGRGGLL